MRGAIDAVTCLTCSVACIMSGELSIELLQAILKYVLYRSVSTVKYGTNTRSRPAIAVR